MQQDYVTKTEFKASMGDIGQNFKAVFNKLDSFQGKMDGFETKLDNFETRIDARIDAAIERERKIFVHELKLEREFWKDDLKTVIEMVQDKPSRSEAREMIEASRK